MFSIIIVDYKSISRTIEYMNELLKKTICKNILNFIIVDNSQYNDAFKYCDNTCLLIEKNSEIINSVKYVYNKYKMSNLEFIVISSQKNLGYAKGNNVGAILADKLYNPKYLVFSNNDLRINNEIDWIKYDDFFNNHADCAMIGPNIKEKKDGSNVNPLKKQTLFSELFYYYYDCLSMHTLSKFKTNTNTNTNDQDDCYKKCDALAGCFVVCDKRKFFEVGMYDENTFLYYEEHIISERIRHRGYNCYYINDSSGIVHEHAVTTKKFLKIFKGDNISFKSRIYYVKNYRNCNNIIILLAIINYWSVFMPLAIVKRILKLMIFKK